MERYNFWVRLQWRPQHRRNHLYQALQSSALIPATAPGPLYACVRHIQLLSLLFTILVFQAGLR
jgi:hypothetical protein